MTCANSGEVSESKGNIMRRVAALIAALFGSKVLRLVGARDQSELARGTAQANLGGGSLPWPHRHHTAHPRRSSHTDTRPTLRPRPAARLTGLAETG